MKKLILISFLSLFCAVQAQEKVFYYDEFGGKIYLTKESNVKFICFANEPDASCLNHDFHKINKMPKINPANPKNLMKITVQTK